MKTIILHVSKSKVWEEVAKTASYSGAKMTDDEDAYKRILVTDEDATAWQRFWEDAASTANERLKEMLLSASAVSEDYNVTLGVSSSYDTVLNSSVETSLTSYFILSITGRWYQFTNKKESGEYLAESAAMINEALRKLYSRKRPQRPVSKA